MRSRWDITCDVASRLFKIAAVAMKETTRGMSVCSSSNMEVPGTRSDPYLSFATKAAVEHPAKERGGVEAI